jgi:hypothetical protein
VVEACVHAERRATRPSGRGPNGIAKQERVGELKGGPFAASARRWPATNTATNQNHARQRQQLQRPARAANPEGIGVAEVLPVETPRRRRAAFRAQRRLAEPAEVVAARDAEDVCPSPPAG